MQTIGRIRDFTSPGVYLDFLDRNEAFAPRIQRYLGAPSHELVVMPDLRPDIALPTGTCLFTADRIYPFGIGTDPGCGYGLWRLPDMAHALDASLVEHLTSRLLGPPTAEERAFVADRLDAPSRLLDLFLPGAAQLAAGNHYIELHRPLNQGQLAGPSDLLLVVHNGSLDAGLKVQVHALRLAGVASATVEREMPFASLAVGTPEADRYLELHDLALRFATLNRALLAQRVARLLGDPSLEFLSDMVHSGFSTTSWGYAHRSGTQLLMGEPAAFIGIAMMERGYLIRPGDRLSDSRHIIPHGVGPQSASTQHPRRAIGSNLSMAELQGMREAWQDHSTGIEGLERMGVLTIDVQTEPLVILKARPMDDRQARPRHA